MIGDKSILDVALDGSVTDAGLGLDQAWQRFEDVVAPNNIGLDSERFLAFIPLSPSVASVWMDTIVSAANFSAESWLEGAGAVAAENQVIDLLCTASGMPAGAAGCFMSGGSIGNLSALAVGRRTLPAAVRCRRRLRTPGRQRPASARSDLWWCPRAPIAGSPAKRRKTSADGRMSASLLRPVVRLTQASSTISPVADVASEIDAWFHVDGAYGLAAPCRRSCDRFVGLERADSPSIRTSGCSHSGLKVLVYCNRGLPARSTHAGPYIDALRTGDDAYNPCDLGYQLTRRASGLPIWFALALHGIDAHRDAIRHGLRLAAVMADALEAEPSTELIMRPELGVVLFRRDGWGAPEWKVWATDLLDAGTAFVAPSTYKGEPIGRLVFMHPRTPESVIDELMLSLRA